jgi:predicted cupin superfamily sugar epimerase
MTAAEVKSLLNLTPHPREGGWFVRTWESPDTLHLPHYAGPRRTSTAIYYLLEAGTFSELHRLRSDEIFHFYLGDPVEMLQLAEGQPGRLIALGPDLAAGQHPQAAVPRGVWQGSRLAAGGAWALLGCTVSPGFEYEDYEAADPAELCALWPEWSDTIRALTR